MEGTLRKLVVRTVDGRVIPGFGRERDFGERVRIVDREGKDQVFLAEDLKAVFFVKDFSGDSKRNDLQFLAIQDPPEEVWLRIEFSDGEVLECWAQNQVDLLLSPGIHVWPSDRQSNNTKIYVFRHAIRKFAFLGSR